MKKVILVTGISSGFGKQTARLLAAKGHTVYGTVRKETENEPGVNYLIMDLLNSESIKSTIGTILEKEGRIDVLINNAGAHTGGPIETSPVENIRVQMDTNFMGLVHITKEVLPVMRKQGGGTIVNFSSIGGLMGLPFQGYYSASKFAIEGFSEALRMEVAEYKINIVLINPGDFHTSNSANRRNYLAPTGPEDPYNAQYEKSMVQIEKDEANGWDPAKLAAQIVGIAESNNPKQRYIISSFEQKLAVALKYVLPGKIFRMILQDHYKIKGK